MKYAHNATTGVRVVRSVAELQMALADKARGQRIARLRERKHLTQQAMSERLGIAYRTYQTWEAGTMPEWDNLVKLALFHKVRPEDITGADEVAPTATQADRIEAKLDAILAHLGVEVSEPDDLLEQELEAAAATSRKRAASTGSAGRGQKRKAL